MSFTKIVTVAALVGAMATPALARDGWRHGGHRGGFPVGAVIAGAAIGTAAAIATAPRYGYAYGDSYAYDNGYYGDGAYAYGPPVYDQAPSYAVRQNGFVCQPGTYYRNENGKVQLCQ